MRVRKGQTVVKEAMSVGEEKPNDWPWPLVWMAGCVSGTPLEEHCGGCQWSRRKPSLVGLVVVGTAAHLHPYRSVISY